MKKQIWKYPITDPQDNITIDMPEGAEILSFQMQNDIPCIWALVNPEQTFKTSRHFRLAGTGHDILNDNLKFIGTIQMLSGKLIFHLFEKI